MNTINRAWPGTTPFQEPRVGIGRSPWHTARGHLAVAMQALGSALGSIACRRVRPLVLDLPERAVTFNGVAEFEFCLDSRTEYPVGRIAELVDLSGDALRKRAAEIRTVEKRFADALARTIREPDAVGELLHSLVGKLFSQDHDWREIADCVAHQPPQFDAYKRLVLVKYLQYLGSRQEVLRSLYAERMRDTTADARPVEPAAPPVAAPRRAETHDDTRIAALNETAIFDLAAPANEHAATHLELPRGEEVEVQLHDGREMPMLLAGERFTLFPGQHFHLVDAAGTVHPLRPGRNVVGRHASNEVVVAPSQRSISRRHLVIEPVGVYGVRLTDLSSLGTALPREYLASSAR